MPIEIFLELIQNAALLLSIALIYDMTLVRTSIKKHVWLRPVLLGLVLSIIAVALMLTPWTFTPGIIYDTRTVLLSTCGLFFGGLPTAVVMLVASAFRLSQGGAAAWVGTGTILLSGSMGLLWRRLRKGSLIDITPWQLYLFGLLVHVGMLAVQLGLPWNTAQTVLASISLPVLAIFPVANLILGLFLINRLRREAVGMALRESEERLRLAAGAANIGFFDRDLRTGQVHYSPEWKKQIGYQPDEIEGRQEEWLNRLHPEDRRAAERISECIREKRPEYEATFRLRHKDGSYRTILSRGLIQFDEQGQPVRLLGFHLDITELKLAEQAVRQSEQRFVQIFRATPAAQALTVITDGRILDVNDAWVRLFGFSREEALGKNYVSLGIYDDTDRQRYILDPLQKQETLSNIEVPTRTKAGEAIIVQSSVEVTEIGGVVCLLSTAIDVTAANRATEALRRSEENYRLIFNQTADGIFIADQEGNYLDVNPSGCALLGYTRDELLHLNLSDLVPPEDYQRMPLRIKELRTGQLVFSERRLRRKDGQLVAVEISGQMLPDGRLQASVHDISGRKRIEAQQLAQQNELQRLLAETDRSRLALLSLAEDQKRAEDQIRQLNTELEQRVHDRTALLEAANRELESFAYSVSHDLRAPLRAMEGFSAILIEDYGKYLDEEGRSYLQRIQDASQRMGQLINDLLSLAQVTRTAFTRQTVDLSAMAQEICAALIAQEPHRVVETVIQPGIVANADARLLRTVLTNLLNNAFKFSALRPVARIEVGVQIEDDQRVYYVRDNGSGFDMAYADKLFAPFQRLHGMREFSGTGIGLVTVQRIISRHGGRIWPLAVVDQGATFYFTLGES